MGELAAVVAHQINNPLTTIIVDTELMLMDEPKDSRNHASLMAINRAGKRAANVARRLLAIARPTDPDTPPDLIDVVDTVRGVLTLVQTHVERNNVKINPDIPDSGIPPVLAVKGRLDDVWLNLIMNAHDAFVGMNEEREDKTIDIKVRYLSEIKHIEVVVADNGMGIPEEIKAQIFSPFFTTKPVGEGTGLGLHVCREVVENSGGKIWVESTPKKFTRFYVHLPAAKTRS
jgi:two-component system NtrC family sensor kinase